MLQRSTLRQNSGRSCPGGMHSQELWIVDERSVEDYSSLMAILGFLGSQGRVSPNVGVRGTAEVTVALFITGVCSFVWEAW